ncbi:MAG: hypothetical protein M0R38_02700 [Bacteroidia bacterium]|nr:hypothetical protein [Bacteroidia bacterium]
MELTEKDIELFDRYIKGILTQDELIAFEQKLQQDATLKQHFELYSTLVSGIQFKAREELKKKIAAEGEVKYIQNIWGKKGTMAAAAVLVFFIGLYFVFESNLFKQQNKATDSEQSIAMQDDTKPANKPSFKKTHIEKPNAAEQSSDSVLNSDSFSTDVADTTDFAIAMLDEKSVPADDVEEDSSPVDIAGGVSVRKEVYAAPSAANDDFKVMSGQLLVDSFFAALRIDEEQFVLNNKMDEEDLRYANIHIQFWKSPLNSKVYSFAIKNEVPTLAIYGINPTDVGRSFYNENKEVILIVNKQAYKFSMNRGAFQPLSTVSDQHLLNALIHFHED